MREYETTFVVQPEISDEGRAAIFERLDGILESHKGIRLIYEDWGKKKLAYEIQKFQKGHYILLSYLDSGTSVPDLERALRLDESILRFLTIQVSDNVVDIEARKERAAEDDRIQTQKAADRAAREAEEQKAREERAKEEAELRAKEQAAAEAAAATAAEASPETEAETSDEESTTPEGDGAKKPDEGKDSEAGPDAAAPADEEPKTEQPAGGE